jgi:hypothetical protein
MQRVVPSLSTIMALGLLVAAPAAGQTVEDVVNQMYDALERYSANVENYTVLQTLMGVETMTYYEKEVVDGRPMFVVQETRGAGVTMSVGDDDMGYGDVSQLGPDLIEHARYAGREEVDGTAVHVLAIDDLSELDFAGPRGAEEMDFVATSARLYIDVEMLVPRRMSFDGEATTESGVHDVTTNIALTDYREVEGLPVPYRSVITIEGVEAMIDPEMRAQYEQMQEQLESLPESQRAMFEQMMGAQMEQIRAMMEGEGDTMTMELVVTDVRINEGPPTG